MQDGMVGLSTHLSISLNHTIRNIHTYGRPGYNIEYSQTNSISLFLNKKSRHFRRGLSSVILIVGLGG